MVLDLKNPFAVVAFVKATEQQAEKAVQEQNFRAATVCYKEILGAVYGYFGGVLQSTPNVMATPRLATPEEVYLSDSAKWFEGLTRAATELLPPQEKAFMEPFNAFRFQNTEIVDAATLLSDAKKHLDGGMEFLLKNYVTGKVPDPIVGIVQGFATGKTSRREAMRQLKECKERFRKCQRLIAGLMALDSIKPSTTSH